MSLAIQERRTVVARLGALGLTAAAIARKMGAPYQTVVNDAKIVNVALVKPDDWWGKEDREATLRKLHADNVTYPEIAKILGCSLTKAKSKAARLKLPARTDAGKRRAEAPVKAPPVVKVEPPKVVIPEGPGVPLIGLARGLCKWPKDLMSVVPTAEMLCCGLPARPKVSEYKGFDPYCVGHCSVAFYPPRPRKRRDAWKA